MVSKRRLPDQWTEEEFRDEILMRKLFYEAESELLFVEDIKRADQRIRHPRSEEERRRASLRLWNAILALVTTVGYLSDTFWTDGPQPKPNSPPNVTYRYQAAMRLRSSLKVGRGSPLHLKGIRNDYVHCFERILEYWRLHPFQDFADGQWFLSEGGLQPDQATALRWYDAHTRTIHFGPRSTPIPELERELQRLRGLLIDRVPMLKQGYRLKQKLERIEAERLSTTGGG